MDNAKDNDNKTNRTPLEELLDRLRKSGMEVTNVTRPGRAIGILGGVRQPGNSVQDQKRIHDSKDRSVITRILAE